MMSDDLFKIERKYFRFTSRKDMAIEKCYLNMDNSFVDFPNNIRFEIIDGPTSDWMTFNLVEKDNINALYKCTSTRGEKLIIISNLPKGC